MNVTPALPVDNCNGSDGSTATNYAVWEKVLICGFAIVLSFMTVIGNSMVMISFKIDKQLQTISNQFLFSLAVADFAIGLISMPLFTVYTVLGYWPLGARICDTWLALDYLASNASVLNLLIISFDRYFSVTRPLTYRAKRSPNKAGIMIACAWGISLLLWPPWIYAWPYIEGERTVPENECYIQFIETNHYITFGTAIAAFYVPVTVMCVLYWRIWRETEKRKKDLTNLQASNDQDHSKRSNSSRSDDVLDSEGPRRARSESSTGGDDLNSTQLASSYLDKHYPAYMTQQQHRPMSWTSMKMWCIAWWHSGREDEEEEEEDDEAGGTDVSSRTVPGYDETLTPLSVETPFTSEQQQQQQDASSRSQRSAELAIRNIPTDSIYTIVIKLPVSEAPSIRMYHEDFINEDQNVRDTSRSSSNVIRRHSEIPDIRIPLDAKAVQAKKLLALGKSTAALNKQAVAQKKKRTQEKKAAKTVTAILAAFVITWTPYNILVLLKPLTKACVVTIPQELWSFFYYLCYINSTINPVCYALCNTTFRRTFVRILKCKWHSRNRSANWGYCPQ